MEFCPKCGMRLVLEQKPSNGEGDFSLVCLKCDYKKPLSREEPFTPKPVRYFGADLEKEQERITVISEEQAKIRTMPITKAECPKCSNRNAYWWMVQTRGADETTTQFFRCTKCNYTWRELD